MCRLIEIEVLKDSNINESYQKDSLHLHHITWSYMCITDFWGWIG